MDLIIPDKVHDESRQGEALALENVGSKPDGRKLYIESYGCAMNFSDSEIVASILSESGFQTTQDFNQADVIFINTCSIRENAEQRVRNRLREFTIAKVKNPGLIVGVLGCMAERLKSKFLEEEKLVDVVVGPDAYRDLPNLIEQADGGQRAVNVLLSREETYADISPVRLNSNGINAFVSIMRGCDNMCSFCVVPFTRGRERSRDPQSIVAECTDLFNHGYREVTLLGQNVDSYKWASTSLTPALSKGEGVAGTQPSVVKNFGYETADSKIWEILKANSQENRRNPTEAENILWRLLRNNQTGYKIRRQHAINGYIADFVCLTKGLVIEIDGGYHKATKEDDKVRTEVLNREGFEVIRFFNNDVISDSQKVIQAIKRALESQPERKIPFSLSNEEEQLNEQEQKVLSFGEDEGGLRRLGEAINTVTEGGALNEQEQKVLSFGEDEGGLRRLGEANPAAPFGEDEGGLRRLGEANRAASPTPTFSDEEKQSNEEKQKVLSFGEDLGEAKTASVNFASLLEMVALISPDLRVRFSTSHPKDITDEVLYTIKKYDNICKYIHLPVQSGNSRVLELMNRTYDREWYIGRIDAIRRIIPECAISTDVITGFCSETEEEHQDTLSMMDYVHYDFAYMFMYSERPGTLAAKRYADDIPDDVKRRRLKEVVAKQQEYSHLNLKNKIGTTQKVLIEGFSKKSDKDYSGRSDQNAMVVFPVHENYKPGQYVNVLVERCTTATLIGKVIS